MDQYGQCVEYRPGELPMAMAALAEQLEACFPGKTATWIHTPGRDGGLPTIAWKLHSDTPPAGWP